MARRDEKFLSLARDRFRIGMNADQADRREAADDVLFAAALPSRFGDNVAGSTQWPAEAIKQRIDARRPICTWNRLPTYIRQIVNAGRETKPAIKIAAMDGGTQETAEMQQSRIRQIEYDSNADIAYDTARDQQVTCGRGFIRISTEYIPGTFRQRICVEPIPNQFSVVWDPSAKKYDKSDADWWFVVEYVSKEKHLRDYGRDSVIAGMDFANMGDADNPAPDWIGIGPDGQLIQIAEYWLKEYTKRKLLLIAAPVGDGTQIPIWENECPPELREFAVEERWENDCKVKQYIINGAEILEEHDWLDYDIPIVPIWGHVEVVEGRSRTFSLIRDAKEPQRLVNLYVSNIAELIAQMPKSPWMVPIGGIPENLVNDWRELNNSPASYALYNSYDAQARPLEKPYRITSEPPIQALTIALQQAIDGIKASMGIYDASIGARSNETSGIAIERRQKESDITNFHFSDNEARSRKQIGSILLRLIPKVDQAGSVVAIRSEDGKTQNVPVGVPYQDPKTGKQITHDLKAGNYGVAVETGPTYTSMMQELAERDAQLITAMPELLFVFGDQYFRADGTPGSQERAERMKRAINMKTPGLIEKEQGDGPPIPPEAEQEIIMLTKQRDEAMAFAQQQFEELKAKKPEIEKDLELKRMDIDWQRQKEQIITERELAKLGSQEAIVALKGDLDRITKQMEMFAAEQARREQHEQALEMADAQHMSALEQNAQASELAAESASEGA